MYSKCVARSPRFPALKVLLTVLQSYRPTVLQSYRPTVLLAFILTVLPSYTSAQKLDSLLRVHDTATIVYFQHHLDSLALENLHYIRATRLTGFQRYNPLYRENNFYASFANVGHAHHNLVFQPGQENAFYTGMNVFQAYTFTNQNTRYYNTIIPVTYLAYTNGSKKEQWFRVIHSHAITRNLYLGVDFALINSPGRFNNSKSDDKSVVFTGQYFTKNMRFGSVANYRHNKFVLRENGGLADDSVFEDKKETDPQFMSVNLTTAQNLVKESGVFANAYFYLSGPHTVNDSVETKPPTFHAGRIAYDFDFKRQTQFYTDNNPLADFYQPFGPIIDSVKTFDSLLIRSFENRFTWTNLRMNEDPGNKHIFILFGIKNQYTIYSDSVVNRTFNTWVPEAAIIIRPYRTLAIDLSGTFTLGDYNSAGIRLKGTAKQEIILKNEKPASAAFNFLFLTQQAGYLYNYFNSNYFRWDTTFSQQKLIRAGIALNYSSLLLKIDYNLIGDHVYLDQLARPVQHKGTVNVISAALSDEFRWRKWSLEGSLVYQYISNKDIIRLPDFMARVSIFPTLPLFQNAAVLQPGVDIFYNTAYYANAYMPALRMFHLQDDKKIGNYAYIDVFVNLMVKRFRIFAKYEHLNALWSQPKYYMVPHYPAQGAAFKFGLSWSFYD